MSTEAQREAFEAWARDYGYQRDELDRCRIGIVGPAYYNANTETAWQAWQAAQQAALLSVPQWPDDLSSKARTQPERFGVILRDNGDPVIDDDDFRFDALIVVHGDFDEGEKEKYVAEVVRRLNGAPTPPQPTEAEIKNLSPDEITRIAVDSFKASDTDIYPRHCDVRVDRAFAYAVIEAFCKKNGIAAPE